MPRVSLRKIKSALKTQSSAFLVVGLIAAACIVLVVGIFASRESGTTLRTDDMVYQLEEAMTSEVQARGLSGRSKLAADTGMIFMYPQQGERCFWMKGMQISIDIIWVDSRKKVTHVEDDLSPATYPQSYCHEAQYVIELNTGEAKRGDIAAGSLLDF